MAEKGFGVKEVNLIGASGTPTITSPNNLNLNANNVAISTNVSIGGTLSVTGNVSVGGTLTYEDVTNIDSIGIITARSVIHAGAGLTVTGITTFRSDVIFGDYLGANGAPIITFDESADLLWFKKQTAGGSSSKIWLGGGTSYDNLQLQQTYTGGGQSEITATHSNILIATNSAEKNITIQSTNDITLANGVYPFIKCEENSSSDQSVTLYHGQTGSTPYANPKLVTANTGVVITGICTATTFSGSGASLTTLNATQLTSGTIPDARFPSTLPAVSGANLTNIAAPVEAPVVNFTVTANGSSAYRFSGGGVDSSADDPDLYLIRGQKYRFNNTTGSAHPFQFRLTTGGSAYTDGITGDQNGVQFFTPALDAPSKLYYVCTLHSNMVGTIYLRGAGGNNENVGVTTFSSSAALHTNKVLPVGGVASSGGTTYGGGIVQTIFAENNTIQTFSFNNASFSPQTVCSATITPKSNTSKILIHCSAGVFVDNESSQSFEFSLHLKRGSTLIGGNTQSGKFLGTNVLFSGINAPECATTGTFFYMDSPATTSAVTYNLCLQGGETRTYGVCRSQYSSNNYNFTNSSGTNITLMEVSA